MNFKTKYDSINEIFLTTDRFLQESTGYGLVGEDATIKRLFTNEETRESIITSMVEGVSADEEVQLRQLLENTARRTIQESAGGIAGLASLNMPVIRKLWYKTRAKDALKTVVANSPTMAVAYTKPYLFRYVGGVKETKDLPYGAMYANAALNAANGLDLYSGDGLDFQSVTSIKPLTDAAGLNGTMVTIDYCEGSDIDEIDRDYFVDKVEVYAAAVKVVDGKVVNADDTDAVLEESYYVGLEKPIADTIYGTLIVPSTATVDAGKVAGQIVVNVAMTKGTADISVLKGAFGALKDAVSGSVVVYTRAHLSAEKNVASWSVATEIAKQEITIGTGTHINAPMTIESIQDSEALYKIDLTAEITDVMTQVFAQRLDEELIDFMIRKFVNRPTNVEFRNNPAYTGAAAHTYTFDVATMTGYTGGPKAWREELKPVIDDAAIAIMEESRFQEGTFVLICHPKTAQLLKNPEWQYKGGNGGNVDGTSVSFDTAVFTSDSFIYKLISSFNYPKGMIGLSFIPAGEKQLSQVYYPYAFTMSTSAGYRDPNQENTPSLVMTKRHAKWEFTPTSALIVIKNLDGTSRFHAGNLWSNQFLSNADVQNGDLIYTPKP